MESVRIYEIPACRMVSSGSGMFGDGVLEKFMEWMDGQKRSMFPKDFLWFDGRGFVWYYLYEDGINVPDEFEIVDFAGGLYAVGTGIDEDEADAVRTKAEIDAFIEKSGCFEKDPTRAELGNIITSGAAQKAMGYCQMDYYTPVRLRADG